MGKLPTKEEVDERENAHNHAPNRVASLPPDAIDHTGDRGTADDGGEGEDAHNNPYVRLGASMARNEKGKEEEGTETRYDKQVLQRPW